MNSPQIAGIVIFFLGIIMIVFRKSLSHVFCRLGKRVFDSAPEIMKANPIINQNEINKIYNEEKAPYAFLVLGIINIIQGPFIFLIGYLIKG